jgi:hypothetical protein
VIDKYKDKKGKTTKPASSIKASDVIVVQPL